MTPNKPTTSVENFVKAVYALQHDHADGPEARISTNALAEALRVKAPSITDMARRLEADGLVAYQKYYGVSLTPAGEALALRVLRRHRLIEAFLVQALGYALHEVHDEAEVLEHAVSDRFIEAVAQHLGDPQHDPHGDPIPNAEGEMAVQALLPLTDLPEGVPAVVRRLRTDGEDAQAMLRHILGRGLGVGAQVRVTLRDPFEGPLHVDVNGARCTLGHTVASAVWVEPVGEGVGGGQQRR